MEPHSPVNFRLRISGAVAFRNVDGEAVLLDLRTGGLFSLNEVATRIWELLNTGRSAEEIVRQLTNEYEVSHARCWADLVELVEELERSGLVQVREQA